MPKTPRADSVFINCPFDPQYWPLLEVIVFTVLACGFRPRSALEAAGSGDVRLEKILRLIDESRLGIHDISRVELDRDNGLPGFNMPFELGIFVGAKAFGSADQKRKACIVFDTERYRYQKFLSDIAGQDIRAHGRKVERVIQQVRDFLATHCPPDVVLPGGRALVERYQRFRRGLRRSCADLHLDPQSLTFRDLTVLIVGWTDKYPLPHHSHAPTLTV